MVAAAAVVSWFVVAAMLSPGQALEFASAATAKLVVSAWPAAAYLIAAFGIGRAVRPILRTSADPTLAAATLGLAFMLTWSHVIGQSGLIGGATGLVAAWTPVALGILLLSRPVSPSAPSLASAQPASVVRHIPAIFGGSALVLAATLSPGTAWPSEFGGFDSLSYHLPLPQEWLARGRLEPLPHNTYSYLPSYLEAAFLHVLVMTHAPAAANLQTGDAAGMLAGDGWRVLSCHFLHAGLGLWTAWATGRLVRAWLHACTITREPWMAESGAAIARTAVLCTPWTLVVGSLSYNELGVTALGAGALLVASDRGLGAWTRGAACGVIVGVAAGVKPTAAFMLGGPTAVLLALTARAREWVPLVISGAAATSLAVLPWTLRNLLACGNPVFPYATGWFGLAQWTPEQLTKYTNAHHEAGDLGHKVALAFSKPGSATSRGLLHAQWALFFPLLAAGLCLAIASPRTRRLGAILAGMTATGLVAWLLLTHIQSRFLVPLLPLGSAAIALGCSASLRSAPGESGRRWSLAGVHAAMTAGLAWFLVKTPIQGTIPWPAEFTGLMFRPVLDRAMPAERLKFFDQDVRPEWFVNLTLPATAKVYLLGGSTPFYYQVPTLYHVAWERSPLGEAMRRTPDGAADAPEAWLGELRARGVTHILADFGELARLTASGYSDDLVTPKAVGDWLAPRCSAVRMWGDRNAPTQVLFSIMPGPRGLALDSGARP